MLGLGHLAALAQLLLLLGALDRGGERLRHGGFLDLALARDARAMLNTAALDVRHSLKLGLLLCLLLALLLL